jgi:hypothetical protein
LDGKGPYQIAKILSKDKIEIPAYYHQKLGIGLWQSREIKDPYYCKTRQAKKEASDAANDKIRAEDQAKGIYYLPNFSLLNETSNKPKA